MKWEKIRKKLKMEIKRIGIITTIGAIIAICGEIWEVFDFHVFKKPKVNISENVDVNYLNAKYDGLNGVYMLFEDQIDQKKKYRFNERCATNISISNNYQKDIQLTKIVFEAKNIKEDNQPYISIETIKNKDNKNQIDLKIGNVGWGKINDLNITIDGKEQDLNDYIKENEYKFYIKCLDSKEEIILPFLKSEDIKNRNLRDKIIDMEVNCKSKKVPVRTFTNNVVVCINGDDLFIPGRGGPEELIYGLKIDTSKEHFTYEQGISEIINAGEIDVFPICIYPDRACTIKFRIGFDIMYEDNIERIYADERELNFFVSSIDGEDRIYDAQQYSTKELDEMITENGGLIVGSYPFTNMNKLGK